MTWRTWRIAAALWLAASPAGAQVYLHSPSEQQATASLVTSLEAARAAHLAAIDRHDAALKESMAREQEAVVRRALAQRDTLLTRYLAGNQRPLRLALEARLRALGSGASPMGGDAFAAPPSLEDRAGITARTRIVRERRLQLDRQLGILRRTAAVKGARVPNCDATRPIVGASPPDAIDPDVAAACRTAHNASESLLRAVPCGRGAETVVLASLAQAGACFDGPLTRAIVFGGEIGEALDAVRELSDAVARQRQAAALVGEELGKLEDYIACERQRGDLPDATARIAQAAAQLDALFRAVAALDGSSPMPDAVAALDRSLPACATGGGEPIDPLPLAKLLAILAQLRDVASDFEAPRAIAAAASERAQDFRAGQAGVLLRAAADPGSPPEGRTATVVAALVRSSGRLETLGQVRAGTLPDTSGALVALADARMRAATAGIEARRLTQLQSLAQTRVAALTNEAMLVQQALAEIGGRAPNAERAVLLYTASVERGRVPAEVVDLRADNLEFEAWSGRERVAIEAAYALLAPAAAELRTYGESGIRPDTIARFLSVAGLGAIAATN